MARRSLKPQLNQIRTWVGQGRTDAWIAHQLEVSVGDLGAFKREHDLAPPEAGEGDADGFGAEDLRAQDEALVAAALEAEPDEEEDEDGADGDGATSATGSDGEDGDEDGGESQARRRRRGRRGGRGRRTGGASRSRALEGTFDHGEEGYGLWLDPAIQDDATYAEHWAGHRPVTVTVQRDQIVIKRAGEPSEDGDAAADGDSDE